MAIVMISCSSRTLRQELAEELFRKLGYPCLCREELTDQATDEGITVGKLEIAVMKASYSSERLARLKEKYLAFITKQICERARSGNLIYHGRAAHLLLANVTHILRVRLVPHMDRWIQSIILQFQMDRDKAEKYVQQVNNDIQKWVEYIHGRGIDDLKLYDLTLNMENINMASAATAICGMAELPDFRPTPVSLQRMENYWLAAQVRLKLLLDDRTADADLTVSANKGMVTITYMPRQSWVASHIPEVLREIQGAKEFQVTMANTNILWIQERFDPASKVFKQLIEVAQSWGAAIELLRYIPTQEVQAVNHEIPLDVLPSPGPRHMEYDGGIKDDEADLPPTDDGGLSPTLEKLIHQGRSGGSHILQGGFRDLSLAISRNVNYSLVVLGNLFLSKPKSAQSRLLRDVKIFLSERVRVPVISIDQLEEKYFFGYRQLIQLVVFAILVGGIYWAVFQYQEPILLFLQEYKGWKILSTIAVVVCAPLIAYFYGTAARLFLKIFKFD